MCWREISVQEEFSNSVLISCDQPEVSSSKTQRQVRWRETGQFWSSTGREEGEGEKQWILRWCEEIAFPFLYLRTPLYTQRATMNFPWFFFFLFFPFFFSFFFFFSGKASIERAAAPRSHGDESWHRGEAKGYHVSQNLHSEARERQVRGKISWCNDICGVYIKASRVSSFVVEQRNCFLSNCSSRRWTRRFSKFQILLYGNFSSLEFWKSRFTPNTVFFSGFREASKIFENNF